MNELFPSELPASTMWPSQVVWKSSTKVSENIIQSHKAIPLENNTIAGP